MNKTLSFTKCLFFNATYLHQCFFLMISRTQPNPNPHHHSPSVVSAKNQRKLTPRFKRRDNVSAFSRAFPQFFGKLRNRVRIISASIGQSRWWNFLLQLSEYTGKRCSQQSTGTGRRSWEFPSRITPPSPLQRCWVLCDVWNMFHNFHTFQVETEPQGLSRATSVAGVAPHLAAGLPPAEPSTYYGAAESGPLLNLDHLSYGQVEPGPPPPCVQPQQQQYSVSLVFQMTNMVKSLPPVQCSK